MWGGGGGGEDKKRYSRLAKHQTIVACSNDQILLDSDSLFTNLHF